ncbi:MAG: hypothetical protein AB7I30_04805, partial [Isosphaeraceae bacterium]
VVPLSLGLLVGHQLLARLVPKVWSAAWYEGTWRSFGSFRRMIWQLSTLVQGRDTSILWGIAALALVTLVLGYRSAMARRLLWVSSVVVILLDAGIVLATFRTSLEAAGTGLR